VKLALAIRDDGASYSYLKRAFPRVPAVAGIMGWTVIVGYVGTLALYAFTFGAYGAELFGEGDDARVRAVLSIGVLVVFMIVNLKGVRTSGIAEDLIVYSKITLLALIAIAGLSSIKRVNLFPILDRGGASIFIAGATLFVAFEGFQLITNAVRETRDPDRNIGRGIYASITVTTLIYLGVAVVAVGSLPPEQLIGAKEYALAVAAEPSLGNSGRVLVSLAALLATSSAINATEFGASRMMAQMSEEQVMPRVFSMRSHRAAVPWVAVLVMTSLGVLFTLLASLATIAAFSSLTFLLVSFGVGIANLRLRAQTHARRWLVVVGLVVVALTTSLVLVHLWRHQRDTFLAMVGLYGAIVVVQIVWTRTRRARATSAHA